MPVSIYGLVDPRTDEIRYVGKTIQPLQMRLQQHVWNARTEHTTHKTARWIKELCDLRMKPRITLLEEVPAARWRQAERHWAEYCESLRGLTNDMFRTGAGGTRSYVSRWTPELEARLGIDPDAVIADAMGITRKAVSYRRRVLGIPASFNRERNTPPPPMAGHNRITLPDATIARLGTEPDYVLGNELGVAKTVIARERRARGIAPYATQSGRTGQFQKGNFPARWKQRTQDGSQRQPN